MTDTRFLRNEKREWRIAVAIFASASLIVILLFIGSAREEILRQAAGIGSTRIVNALLDLGIDPDARDGWNGGPMFYAAAHGHTDVVRLLLERGVDVNQVYRLGKTALKLASENGHLDTVVLLVKHGASVRDEDRKIAMDLARINGHIDVAEYLKQLR